MDFILLLDTSGSMYGEQGEKILALNLAVSGLFEGFLRMSPEPNIAIITFGGTAQLRDFSPASEIPQHAYEARGTTPLTEALALAEPLDALNVTTILLSDGAADDNEFSALRLQGDAYAIAIGADADYEQLARFTRNPAHVFSPSEGRLPWTLH